MYMYVVIVVQDSVVLTVQFAQTIKKVYIAVNVDHLSQSVRMHAVLQMSHEEFMAAPVPLSFTTAHLLSQDAYS